MTFATTGSFVRKARVLACICVEAMFPLRRDIISADLGKSKL